MDTEVEWDEVVLWEMHPWEGQPFPVFTWGPCEP
jgi:hypothetical protein